MKAYDLENINVLIVEDNKHMQLLLREILRAFRVTKVKTAEDGADALKELKTFPADIIICDWVMEPIDGIEFVKMLRTMSDVANPYVGIIMLTGHTEASRVYDARDAGTTTTFQWYAGKLPISGATSMWYSIRKSTKGKRLKVLTTTTKPGYLDVEKVSKPTKKVKRRR